MATTNRIRLTAGRVDSFTCPPGKSQSFLWDTDAPSLQVRVTPTGRKTYAFEARLNGGTIRVPIGTTQEWTLGDARKRANELKQLVDNGQDPREVRQQQQQALEERRREQAAQALTVGDVWPVYLTEGRPKRKDAFKPRYLDDMRKMAAPGGQPKARGQGVTRPGPLYPLMALPLASINSEVLEAWYYRESLTGRYQATRAVMMFSGFLRWCSIHPDYKGLVDRNAANTEAIKTNMPKSNTHRTDVLEAAQVPYWWQSVVKLNNPVANTYLRALLLTGARREEMAALTWANVDFQWRKLTIADKEDATRTIPLTPYLAQMLAALPRVGPYVFAGTGKTGHITDARNSHTKALQDAGIGHLTLHGLRRSFATLGEASGAPEGAIAQTMGHKPSAVADGYKPRSIDALRPFLEHIESYILQLAGVQFDRNATPGKLALVA